MKRLEKHIGVVLIKLRTGVFDGNSVPRRNAHALRLFLRAGLDSELAALLAVNGREKRRAQHSVGTAAYRLPPHGKLHGSLVRAGGVVSRSLGAVLEGFLQAGKLAVEFLGIAHCRPLP